MLINSQIIRHFFLFTAQSWYIMTVNCVFYCYCGSATFDEITYMWGYCLYSRDASLPLFFSEDSNSLYRGEKMDNMGGGRNVKDMKGQKQKAANEEQTYGGKANERQTGEG